MVKRQRIFLLVSTVILCITAIGQATYAATVPAEVIDAANGGLPKFLDLIQADDVRHYGFDNPAELSRVVLGNPFLIYTLWPDDILAFAEGRAVDLPIRPTSMWQFPVLCDGEVRTLLTVDLMDGRWEAVKIGGLAPGPEMAGLAERWQESGGYDLKYVHVFQTGSQFIAVTREKTTRFVPIEWTARALGLLHEEEEFRYRRMNPSEIIPVLAPHVRANVELIEE